ncbi:MAG: TldD/PmbA family protein [Candidatus Atribacteria bacterium]|nr:MAG: TldD/PmbA family protein [Candidatus Atribacteria bacterium]
MRWWVAVAWIEDLIKEGQKKADEVEVFYVQGTSVSVDLKKKKLDLATTSEDCGLGIRTIHKGRIGSSSTNNPDRWQECLKAAIASGNLATPQDWGGLPDKVQLSRTALSFDASVRIEPLVVIVLIEKMLEGAAEHPAEVTSGSASLSSATVTLANSKGIRYSDRRTGVSLSLEAIHRQSTGYEFDHSPFMDKVDPVSVGERATFFAMESDNGKEIATGEYEILLSPLAYGELLGNVFVPALSGRNVHAGRSRLAQSLGETVTDHHISMYDDPLLKKASGSVRWDAEGTPTRRVDFIEKGILKTFAYDLKTAYRFGKTSTASAIRGGFGGLPSLGHHNFIVDGKRDEVADERVVYIHNVVGAHTANPMSGDFSVELSNAFWMEGGEFDAPIRSAMLSGNVFDMHQNISGLSKESRAIGSMILPSIKINKQRISGK